jgi:hypothetical protein
MWTRFWRPWGLVGPSGGVVATLHRGATASFLLDRVTREVPISFSIRQGDPIAMLLFNIQLQPFLLRLEDILPGVAFPDFEERVEAYVDDVVVVGEDEADLLIINVISRQFEAISGAILNCTHKTAILGLGGWAGRKNWPLSWVSAPESLKTFGVTFAPSLGATISLSWEDCLGRVQGAISGWRARQVPFLNEMRDVLETFIFIKLWYSAQILPLPQSVAAKDTGLAGSLLWGGHGERLAWQEQHNRREAGGLAVSCVFMRGQALLAKQMCLQVAAGSTLAAHLTFWLGPVVGHFVPSLAAGSHSPRPPAGLVQAADVLVELFSFGTVPPDSLASATAAAIYRVFMDTPPPPWSRPSGPGTGGWFGAGCGALGCPLLWWTRCFSCSTTCCPCGAVWPPWAWWPMAATLTVGLSRPPAISSSSAPTLLTFGMASMPGWWSWCLACPQTWSSCCWPSRPLHWLWSGWWLPTWLSWWPSCGRPGLASGR